MQNNDFLSLRGHVSSLDHAPQWGGKAKMSTCKYSFWSERTNVVGLNQYCVWYIFRCRIHKQINYRYYFLQQNNYDSHTKDSQFYICKMMVSGITLSINHELMALWSSLFFCFVYFFKLDFIGHQGLILPEITLSDDFRTGNTCSSCPLVWEK